VNDDSTIVLRNARLVDGSGAPERPADVVIRGEHVVDVTSPRRASTVSARKVIEASGLIVTPGFVDVHTHYDAQATWDPYVTPSSWHGVTTAVMGNCGVGFAPARPDRHDWLIELMEGVEDIPGTALAEGITWDWITFPEYLDALERSPRVLDIGAQIAHGPLRAYVMGERGARNEPATPDDIREMARLVEQALRAGALGFSTSRTPIHRSRSGELVPGTTADEDELFGIGEAMRRAGHGVFQYAPEHAALLDREWGWMREFAARTNRTLSVNLNQTGAAPDLWRDVLHARDEASDEGLPIVAQVAGRSIGVVQCLEGTVHPLLFHPAHAEVADLPFPERLAALRDPERRRRLVEDVPDDGGFFRAAVLDRFDRTWLIEGDEIDYEPSADTSVSTLAAQRGVTPMELVVEHLLSGDGSGMLYAPFFNYEYGDLSMTHELLQHPGTRMGLSDAGAHCGAICDGGTPTFMLTHWVRDRTRGPRLPLEFVVHRQTQATALLHGLADRGLVAPGMRADLLVIDLDGLGFETPRLVHDLPAGGRRLVQRARGYVAAFVAGEQTIDHDEFTGALPGRLVRGPRRRPAA
jgi:N-acyl-D-amino-acid deacylase